ncbi:MAG: flagellar biosynthetic protein FliO [Treponema sp.]|nr:flagellar biosynthetic protein FliO [Treponema sp.]
MFALLLFGVGFFVSISSISAQEVSQQEVYDGQAPSSAENENPLRAAEQAITIGAGNAAQTAEGSSIWVVIRMILVLALAAAAVYGVVFFIKRSSKQAASSDPFLKVLATSYLGSNRYAHIVAVGSKAWLLGSSDGGVNLIGEIDDKDIINAMLLEESVKSAQATQGHSPDFITMLRRLGAPAEARTPAAGDIRKRRERLKRL